MGFSTSATGGGGGGGSFGLDDAAAAAAAAADLAWASLSEGASWLKMLESEERAFAFRRSRVVSLNIRSELEPPSPRRSLSSETERSVENSCLCETEWKGGEGSPESHSISPLFLLWLND